jgi:hypothetical protein
MRMTTATRILYAVAGLLVVAGCENRSRDRDDTDRTAPMPRESTDTPTTPTPGAGVSDEPTVPPSPGTSTEIPSPGTTTQPMGPPQPPSGTGTTTQPGTGTTGDTGTRSGDTVPRAPEDTTIHKGDAGPIERGRGPETLP